MGDELWRLGALQLAEGIRSRRFSSREVVQAHLDRIAAVDHDVHAFLKALAGRHPHRPSCPSRPTAQITTLSFSNEQQGVFVSSAPTEHVEVLKKVKGGAPGMRVAQRRFLKRPQVRSAWLHGG